MFCPNCGEHLKDQKDPSGKINPLIYEAQVDSSKINVESINKANESEEFLGVCPYCGSPIHNHLDENDVKSLNQVAHSKVHSATNKFNSGMCGIVIGTILLLIALIFFLLSFSSRDNYKFRPDTEPFFVFCGLSILSIVSYVYGIILLVKSRKLKKRYSSLIKEITNKTFVQ